MKVFLKKSAHIVTATAAWLAVAFLWASALSVYVSPARSALAGLLGLAFPCALIAVVGMALFTLVFSRRHLWVPLLGLALCWGRVREYVPVNFSSEPPAGALKLITYNVHGFSDHTNTPRLTYFALEDILTSGADIVCLQEVYYLPSDTATWAAVRERASTVYAHHDTVNISTSMLTVFSHYPIVSHETICRDGTNGAAAFKLLLSPTDTLTVVNCHLASMRLSPDEREQYHTIVTKPENTDSTRHSLLRIVRRLVDGNRLRATQAEAVADYVARHRDERLIVCGDFNDTPVSYTHHTIAAAGLTDAYAATGRGPGRSFNRDAIFVRIDQILMSSRLRPYACRIDKTFTHSDHYPAICHFTY